LSKLCRSEEPAKGLWKINVMKGIVNAIKMTKI
jgi:hypothetical protein